MKFEQKLFYGNTEADLKVGRVETERRKGRETEGRSQTPIPQFPLSMNLLSVIFFYL